MGARGAGRSRPAVPYELCFVIRTRPGSRWAVVLRQRLSRNRQPAWALRWRRSYMNSKWSLSRFSLTLICVGSVLFAGAVGFVFLSSQEKPVAERTEIEEPTFSNTGIEALVDWFRLQGQGTATPQVESTDGGSAVLEPAPAQSHEFDLDRVSAVLADLELDDAGNLIVNDSMLPGLNQVFLGTREPLSPAQVEELQLLVRTGLGGSAGEQAADVVERFARYSNAYREVGSSLQAEVEPDVLAGYLEQLEIMRRAHLGDELAGALFDREEEMTRYTIESMRLDRDRTLSEQERQARRQVLTDKVQQLLSNDPGPAGP
ncbi:MAG: hypothetical protein CL583_11590 [Alteromonadaceae bacterium]|nr:hypothetical protein [Alteromonadaceae bacterium]